MLYIDIIVQRQSAVTSVKELPARNSQNNCSLYINSRMHVITFLLVIGRLTVKRLRITAAATANNSTPTLYEHDLIGVNDNEHQSAYQTNTTENPVNSFEFTNPVQFGCPTQDPTTSNN